LKSLDFSVLAKPFAAEICRQLPMPTTPLFLHGDYGILPEEGRQRVPAGLIEEVAGLRQAVPRLIQGVPVLPLPLEGEEPVYLLLGGLDPALARKMDPEWLEELRRDILTVLRTIKMAYVHPETGLYNSFLLDMQLQRSSGSQTLMLIAAMYANRKATVALARTMHIARLLESFAPGPLFYFGGNVFGLLHRNMEDRQGALIVARRLLGRMKREGLHRTHIGIAVEAGEEQERSSGHFLVRRCWQALEEAERRGPFSLCETSFLRNRQNHPLSRPSPDVLRRLGRAWKGYDRFGLVLLRIRQEGAGTATDRSLVEVLSRDLEKNIHVIAVSADHAYVLLPGFSAAETKIKGRRIAEATGKSYGPQQVEAGLAQWPCLNFTRTDTAVNCRKALLHGSLLGPGALTMFDHLSLNVSGDHFFDQGDYRRAVKEYRAGLEMAGEEINLLNSLGVALTELNRHRQALGLFDRVLAREPAHFMALVNKGLALRMLDREQEALLCFEQASQDREFGASTVFADISLQLASLYCAAGRFPEAVAVLHRLQREDSDRQSFQLYRLLGEAYAGIADNRKAMASLQKALRCNPQDAGSMSLLGDMYGLEGQGDDIALSLCSQAVELDDASWLHWYRLARLQYRVGDLSNALNTVQQSLRRNRSSSETLLLAGRIYQAMGRNTKAAAMYKRIPGSVPGHGEELAALEKN
jgi:tetratricopeptide (TPR) repeat protein